MTAIDQIKMHLSAIVREVAITHKLKLEWHMAGIDRAISQIIGD